MVPKHNRTLAALGACTLGLALTACSTPQEVTPVAADLDVLTQEQVSGALLLNSEVGEDMVPSDPEALGGESSGADATSFGCLTVVDDVEESGPLADPAATAEVTFEDGSGKVVTNTVSSFSDPAAPVDGLAQMRSSLEGCTTIDEEMEGGRIEMTVAVDSLLQVDGADEQLNVTGTGTVSSPEGLEVPFSMGLSVVRLANNITVIGTAEVFAPSGSQADLTATAAARLQAVMDGAELPLMPLAAPGLALDLTQGSSLTLRGSSRDPGVPVDVAFDSLTCSAVLPELGQDENYEPTDLVARDGDQACLVTLSVTNAGNSPTYLVVDSGVTLLTSEGQTFSITGQSYSQGQIAVDRGTEFAGDSDEINPGKTEYLYLIFEIPQDAIPDAVVFDDVYEWLG